MNIFIAGGTGTLGNELASQLSIDHHVTIFSRDELKQQEMSRRFPRCRFIIGDIKDKSSIDSAVRRTNPDVVYHVAALKQVDTCEANARQCIETNIMGTMNLARSCIEAFVPYMAFSSSDKACLPINIYGQCKAVSERFLFSTNLTQDATKFSVFRWGNVIGSRGSAIPYFIDLLKNEKTIPITDLRMTRFWLPISEAARFFSENCFHAPVDAPMFPPMKSSAVVDVVASLARLLNVKNYNVEVVGIRPGEKIHETIFSSHDGCIRSDTAEKFLPDELDEILRPLAK